MQSVLKHRIVAIAAGVALKNKIGGGSGGSSSLSSQSFKPGNTNIQSIAMMNSGEYNSGTGSKGGLITTDKFAVKVSGEFRVRGSDLVVVLDKTHKKRAGY